MQLTPEQFDHCVRQRPEEALRLFADQLTPDQVAFCLRVKPEKVLEFALWRVTDEQLAALITGDRNRIAPGLDMDILNAALRFAAGRLTDEQFNLCVLRYPWGALVSVDARKRLTPEQLDRCVKASPGIALQVLAEQADAKRAADADSPETIRKMDESLRFPGGVRR